MTTLQDSSSRALAAEDMCRYLSACFYEPAAVFGEEHLFDSMAQAAGRLDPELAERARKLGEAFESQDAQDLLVDYARLFLGPGQPLAAPYGSSWLGKDADVTQDPALAVMDIYRQGGFDVDDGFPDLPDHVAVELEFLYLLLFNRNEARAHGRADDLSEAEQLAGRFLHEHLGAWIGAFTAAVKAGAQTPFYRELAELTEHFVRREKGLAGLH